MFNLLAGAPDDWVVLHSLDLAPWNGRRRTEIDFVVIVPEAGILCIEVKSHQTISFDGAKWHPDEIRRSPFKQAADACYAFKRRVRELVPSMRRVPVVYLCIFTHADFDIGNIVSVQPWELIDRRAFCRFRSALDLSVDLKSRMRRSIAADPDVPPLEDSITASNAERVVQACVPIHLHQPNAAAEIAARERELQKILREQQKYVLRLTEGNQRVVVQGAAGTGKTLIAIEVARRAAERGVRTALLCFNELIGERVRRQVGEGIPNLICGRAVSVLAELAGISIPAESPPAFWKQLPALFEEKITDPDLRFAAQFDCLVLDEAQDFVGHEWLWQLLPAFLKGGFEQGSLAMFGDFDHQVLANPAECRARLAGLERDARPAQWRLSENCRNYSIIGNAACELSGLGTGIYSGFLRLGGALRNYDIDFYDSSESQLSKLRNLITGFQQQGFRPSDITLLSFLPDERSAAAKLFHAGYPLGRAGASHQYVSYASVRRFKGCENKIIVLTDVLLSDREFDRRLFYTGITRATEHLNILCDARSTETLRSWL